MYNCLFYIGKMTFGVVSCTLKSTMPMLTVTVLVLKTTIDVFLVTSGKLEPPQDKNIHILRFAGVIYYFFSLLKLFCSVRNVFVIAVDNTSVRKRRFSSESQRVWLFKFASTVHTFRVAKILTLLTKEIGVCQSRED